MNKEVHSSFSVWSVAWKISVLRVKLRNLRDVLAPVVRQKEECRVCERLI